MSLFGTDGVRGKAGEKLTPFLVMKLAMAAGIYFQKHTNGHANNKILVGKDTRKSGYMIENALVSGLTAVGFNVVQIGPMPTPAIAFLTENMRCDGGIMISASHNPYDDNGIKFFDDWGHKLGEDAEKEIEKIFNDEALIGKYQQTGTKIGSSKRIDDVIGRYIVFIKNSFPKHSNLNGYRIVIDTANGAGYKVAPTIFSELGAEVIILNNEPNGYNINEECGAMHPKNLAKEVIKSRADIGFALDGDADRLVVVDEKGQTVDGDKLIGSLALFLKNEGCLKNSGCVATVMSNGAMERFLKENGIDLIRSNVGDKYVADAMMKNGYIFGGEQSGHIIFSEFAKTGDGLLSALQTMAYLISQKDKVASVLLNPFDLDPQLQTAIKIEEKIPVEAYNGLDKLLKECENKKIRHLIRNSGTEKKIRVLLEGNDKEALKKMFDRVIKLIISENG